MVKLLGAILVLGSCSGAGISYGRRYNRRQQQLRQIIAALELMQSEIGFTATPVLEVLPLLGRVTDGAVASVFREVERRLVSAQGITAAEAWQEAFGIMQGELSLSRQDLEVLRRFAASLDSGGKEEQLKHLQLVQQQLQYQEREAAEDRAKYERLFKTMGVLVGLATVLVFA